MVTSPAIILSAMRYRETSKIVRLATRDLGIQSVVARGASRPRSRFGAALQFLSEGQAAFTTKEGRELHTLVAFDVAVVRLPLARNLVKYAAAAVLAEIAVRFHPAEAQPETYDLLAEGLARLEAAAAEAADALGIALIWRLVDALGFAPALTRCARDESPVDASKPVAFSAADGGALCLTCAPGHAGPTLPPEAFGQLVELVSGSTLPLLDQRHAAAHRRLLGEYVHYHLGEGTMLPALDSWVQGRVR